MRRAVGSNPVVMVGRHGEVPCRIGRAHRGLRGDHQTAGGTGQNPERSGSGRSAAEDGGGRLFVSRAKPRFGHHACVQGAAENSRPQPLRARAACRPIAL